MGRAIHLLLIIAMSIPLFGCSSFEKEWKKAVTSAQTQPASVEGPYEGTWKSHAGHGGGKLRCILTHEEDERYRARFEATFWGIFRGGYTVMLTGTEAGEAVKVQGEEDLGWLAGGKYAYEGTVTTARFDATYTSKHDRGVFEMGRAGTERK